MNCERFRDAIVSDDPSELASAERHANECDHCRPVLEGDRDLGRAVEAWKRRSPAPRPALERRIRDAIRREREPQTATGPARVLPGRAAWIALAASLILALWAGSRIGSVREAAPGSLEQVLAQADRARDAYVRSIAELERRAGVVLDRASDPGLEPARAATLMRYRDRLVYLDSVIAEVQGFLDEYPGYSNGHTVLLAAYQEKQQVLLEILEIQPGDAS